jgi:hypothetical protein
MVEVRYRRNARSDQHISFRIKAVVEEAASRAESGKATAACETTTQRVL